MKDQSVTRTATIPQQLRFFLTLIIFNMAVGSIHAQGSVSPSFYETPLTVSAWGKENEKEIRQVITAKIGQDELDELIMKRGIADVLPTSETLRIVQQCYDLRSTMESKLEEISRSGFVFDKDLKIDISFLGVSHKMKVIENRQIDQNDSSSPHRIRLQLENLSTFRDPDVATSYMEKNNWPPMLISVSFLYPNIGVSHLSGISLWNSHPYLGGDFIISDSDPNSQLVLYAFQNYKTDVHYGFLQLKMLEIGETDGERWVGFRMNGPLKYTIQQPLPHSNRVQ